MSSVLQSAYNDLVVTNSQLRAEVDHQSALIRDLVAALEALDLLFDFSAPADSCPCFLNPEGLNRAMTQARAVIKRAKEQ